MVAKLSRWENRIEVSNALAYRRFHMEPMTSERLYWGTRLLSPLNETGRRFHVNGITVIRQARSAGSAEAGAVSICYTCCGHKACHAHDEHDGKHEKAAP